MVYFTFVGNHDDFDIKTAGPGPLATVFLQYKEQIESVYIYVTPSKPGGADYQSIAEKNSRFIKNENPDLDVNLVQIDLSNPVDFDLVYPTMLNQTQQIIESENLRDAEKLINITSGTPTMTTCWVLLATSGIISNSKLVQSFESRYARERGQSTQQVNLEIDDFPQITIPSAIKRQLTIEHRQREELFIKVKATELDEQVPELIGKSGVIREIKEQILKDINSNTHVLITGERGTGKQIVADAIWRLYHSPKDDKLTTFDCGAFTPSLVIPELFGYKKASFTGATKDNPGILSSCDGKMIFLDEIGNLPLEGQQALLRFINNGEIRQTGSDKIINIDAQVIAATNKNIEDSTLFAQDLKDRFEEIVEVPSLRDRKDDIPLLINHFLQIYSKSNDKGLITLDEEVIQKGIEYDWPGNIRELENWISRICRRFDAGIIKMVDLPRRFITDILNTEEGPILPSLPIHGGLENYVEQIREKARQMSGGNRAEVDRLLGQKEGAERQQQHRKKSKNI